MIQQSQICDLSQDCSINAKIPASNIKDATRKDNQPTGDQTWAGFSMLKLISFH